MKSFLYLSIILTVVIFVIQNDYLKSMLGILGIKIDGGLFEDLIPKILSSLFLILTIFYSAWRAKTWIHFWEKEMQVVQEFTDEINRSRKTLISGGGENSGKIAKIGGMQVVSSPQFDVEFYGDRRNDYRVLKMKFDFLLIKCVFIALF